MMGDGKALQMGTSHELGQNFARAFGIQFSSETGEQEYAWQTSWGASTRLVGALIMVHGDDAGLRLPPRLSPVQVIVLLVRDEEGARRAAEALVDDLRAAGHRVRLDDRVGTSFGRRSVDWELKGVPVRVEVGPRDLAAGEVTVVRRDTTSKRAVAVGGVVDEVSSDLVAVQEGLYAQAESRLAQRTRPVATLDQAVEAATEGFAVIPWDALGVEGEAELAAGGFSVRCLQGAGGGVAAADDEAGLLAVVARAY
jgi:prolyl-tRNA synthetase